MKKPTNKKEKITDQYILFLIDEDDKKVHIEVSANKEPVAVLRKHWRGDDPDTRAVFSKENPKAKPVMCMWYAGNLTRRKAKVFLMEWEQLFTAAGYEIVGSKISHSFRQNPPELSGIEKFAFQKASVSGLLNGDIGRTIKCDEEGGGRRSPFQKFTAEPTDEILRVRVKAKTANNFRSFCERKGLTHGQGLELLMAEYNNDYNPIVQDLQDRLQKANEELDEKKRKIIELRAAVKHAEENNTSTQKYRTAELQGLLLQEFFRTFRIVEYPEELILRPYSFEQGQRVFPEDYEYLFPAEEGVVHILVEHLRYSKGHPACIFIYGRDEDGNKIKIRWYPVKNVKFGQSLLDSPCLIYESPWIFAVQKRGGAMELVGNLPDYGKIFYNADEEPEHMEQEVVEQYTEATGVDRLPSKHETENEVENDCVLKERASDRDVLFDENASLDEKIRAASNKR